MFFVMPHCPPGQLAHFGTNPWETPFAELEDEASLAVIGGIKVSRHAKVNIWFESGHCLSAR